VADFALEEWVSTTLSLGSKGWGGSDSNVDLDPDVLLPTVGITELLVSKSQLAIARLHSSLFPTAGNAQHPLKLTSSSKGFNFSNIPPAVPCGIIDRHSLE
jgi:hypothetical protein